MNDVLVCHECGTAHRACPHRLDKPNKTLAYGVGKVLFQQTRPMTPREEGFLQSCRETLDTSASKQFAFYEAAKERQPTRDTLTRIHETMTTFIGINTAFSPPAIVWLASLRDTLEWEDPEVDYGRLLTTPVAWLISLPVAPTIDNLMQFVFDKGVPEETSYCKAWDYQKRRPEIESLFEGTDATNLLDLHLAWRDTPVKDSDKVVKL